MPEIPIQRLRSMVGDTRRSVEDLAIEAGKVEEFARAIGSEDPAYRSATAAAERGFERVPAPITFLRTSLFPRYGPGETPTDEDRFTLGFDLGFDTRYRIHGEQAYELERPLFVGDTLTGTTTLTDVSERAVADGTLIIAVLETEYVDERGALVATERKTILETPGSIPGRSNGDGGDAGSPAAGKADPDPQKSDYPAVRGAAEVSVGDTGPPVAETVDLVDFVRYAGASCGLDRIHYDRDFVREAGYPDVFAHGMLTAGVTEHMVTRWLGLEPITRLRTRFTSPVWAGDTVTVRGEVVEKRDREDGTVVDVALSGVNQHGETVVEGDATADLPSAPRPS